MPPFVSMLRQIRKRLIEGRSSILEVVTMSTLIEECKGELIYYSLDDKFDPKHSLSRSLDATPWLLAYDYYTDAVVLCVRGTKTLANVLTDMLSRRKSESSDSK